MRDLGEAERAVRERDFARVELAGAGRAPHVDTARVDNQEIGVQAAQRPPYEVEGQLEVGRHKERRRRPRFPYAIQAGYDAEERRVEGEVRGDVGEAVAERQRRGCFFYFRGGPVRTLRRLEVKERAALEVLFPRYVKTAVLDRRRQILERPRHRPGDDVDDQLEPKPFKIIPRLSRERPGRYLVHYHELTAGLEHLPRRLERRELLRAPHLRQRERHHDGVVRLAREGRRRRVPHFELDLVRQPELERLTGGEGYHVGVAVPAGDAGAPVRGEQREGARAAADVEDAVARLEQRRHLVA